ncbi:MAG: MBOAT family protein [Phycisphaerae bacterium]|nr:MBOAT family protein [Phycisphaerae bacterium]
MQFNSIYFFIFFITVAGVYFLVPHRFRWFWLLISSYYFYMCWNVKYALLIATSTLVAYFCGLLTGKARSIFSKRLFLIISLVINLGFLFVFKYFNFFLDSIQKCVNVFSIQMSPIALKLLLPVGISFYTFQALSYTIDVYWGKIVPEKHLGKFALYVSFFPQLVAGPIERATHLLPQFSTQKNFDYDRIKHGFFLMMWGIFKKVVIADNLAMYVDSVYNNAQHHTGPTFLLATYFFAFQIYCDFSGYSDIAIGSAKILGYDLMQNFRQPYFATSTVDFWRRWHISLSTWLRDYLYIPLGGNKKSRNRMYINLLITMLLGGLWHGAVWTFVLWGAIHGILLIVSKVTFSWREKICERIGVPKPIVTILRIIITFNLICLTWVFFRANTVEDAFYILTHLTQGWPNLYYSLPSCFYGALGIIVLLLVQCVQTKREILPLIAKQHIVARWTFYVIFFFSIVMLGIRNGAQFIYFQF